MTLAVAQVSPCAKSPEANAKKPPNKRVRSVFIDPQFTLSAVITITGRVISLREDLNSMKEITEIGTLYFCYRAS